MGFVNKPTPAQKRKERKKCNLIFYLLSLMIQAAI